MIPFPRYIRLTFALSFFLLLVSFVLWYFFPSYRLFTAGYLLGATVSIFNGVILAVKTVKVGEYALGQSRKMQGTGVLQRFLLAGFVGFVAIKFPAYFHWVWVILGLSTVTILSLLIAVTYHFMTSSRRKG